MIKKISRFLLIFICTVALFACDGCKHDHNKKNPTLNDTTSVYVSLKEGDFTYNVTRGELYTFLKKDYGATALVNLIEKDLLATYVNNVSDDDIKNLIDKDVYGDDFDSLTNEEKATKVTEFLNSVYTGFGINATDIYDAKIKQNYRMTLAEKAYAKEVLLKEIADTNEAYEKYNALSDDEKKKAENPQTTPYFTDENYETLYNKANTNKYNCIVVTFPTLLQAQDALAQIGVEVTSTGEWKSLGASLTSEQIASKFIDLYNSCYGYKKINSLASDDLKFDESDLNSAIVSKLNDMETYDATKAVTENWYTNTCLCMGNGSYYAYILNLGSTLYTKYSDLDEASKNSYNTSVYDELVDGKLTSTYISTKVSELRKSKGIVIYDAVIENGYGKIVSQFSVDFEKTNEESSNVVGKCNGVEYTCEQVFEEMEKNFGAGATLELLNNKRLVVNSNLNKYYNYATNTWNDKDLSSELDEKVKEEKKNFNNGDYKEYGYDKSSMSYTTYLEINYGVSTEEEFKTALLVETILQDIKKESNYLVNYKDVTIPATEDSASKVDHQFNMSLEDATNSNLWIALKANMDEDIANYFDVSGMHLLVNSYKNNIDYVDGKNAVDPKDWTEEQKEAANNLLLEVKDYFNSTTGTYEARLKKLVKAYQTAPYDTNDTSNKELQTLTYGDNKSINLSYYKNLGLYVKFEDLGSFKNGKMVESFDAAVKAIYDKDMTDKVYDRLTISDVITTVYGYHLYFNTKSNSLTDLGNGRYLPTLSEIRDYVCGNSVSGNIKTAITTYYSPYAEVVVGDYYYTCQCYNDIKALLSSDSYTTTGSFSFDNVSKYIDLYLDYTFKTYMSSISKSYLK